MRDEENKIWIARLNSLSASIDENHEIREVARALDFMIDYVNLHFETEEKHMTAQAYPAIETHVGQHEEFCAVLSDLVQQFKENGATHVLSNSINNFQIA